VSRAAPAGRGLLPLVLLAGCATTADLPRDGGAATGDALTGRTGPLDAGGGRVPPPSLDWSHPPPNPIQDAGGIPPPPRQDAARPVGCRPGEPLDVCTECGPDGRPTLVEDDDRCPEVSCEALDVYERVVDNGAVVCMQARHRPVGGRCLAARTCREQADAAYCSDVVRVEVRRVEAPCRTLSGCEGDAPPAEEVVAVGMACEGGFCNANGICDDEVAETCHAFTADAACAAGVHNDGTPYCELAQAAEGSCGALCMAARARCLRAWTSAAGQPCVPGEEIGCLDQRAGIVCRCSQP